MPRKTSLLVFAQIVLALSFSKAASPDYYTVQDDTTAALQKEFMDPVATLSDVVDAAAKATASIDLMTWKHHQEPLKDPSIPYNRMDQYGTWVKDPRDGTCYNTRAKALIRASSTPVRFSGSRGCTVKSGEWNDPYSGNQYADAGDLQIDHVVPLKNSYISGAWQWDGKKRCLFANFLSNDYHLLAVNGPDNMKKGDRTPEGFMPPNRAYACDYLASWLKIKLIWNLALTPPEARAISRLKQENHCDADTLSIATQELSQQRREVLANMGLCASKNIN